MKIYSSGGAGDALIVLNKISLYFTETGGPIIFKMLEKHPCQKDAIDDLIKAKKYLRFESGFQLSQNPEKEARELAAKNEGLYFNTRVRDEEYPLSTTFHPYQSKNGIQKIQQPYICVLYAAGRMKDNTKRVISTGNIKKIKESFPEHRILILGSEFIDFDDDLVETKFNKTGRTKSILDAMAYINDADGFIGQDGVLAYYSMMLGKPTIINWHLPNLPEHYFHPEWSQNTIHMYEGVSVSMMSDLEFIAFQDLIATKKVEKKNAE